MISQTESQFSIALQRMEQAIKKLPKSQRAGLLANWEELVKAYQRENRELQAISNQLQQVRLDTSYLLFDLQATQQERDEFRRTVEQLKSE